MKKNIVIALLLITTILMGGTLFYLYTNQDKIFDKCSVEKLYGSKEKLQDKFNLKNKTLIQALDGEYYALYISKEGEAFLTVKSNDNMTNENKEHIKKLQEQYKSNAIDGYCNTDGDLRKEICKDGDSVKSIKIDTKNVIAAYDTINGQDVDSNKVILLKSDGTLDALNIGSIIWSGQDPAIQKNVGDLKNIVTIVNSRTTGTPSGSRYAIAVEKDGTQHSLIGLLNY